MQKPTQKLLGRYKRLTTKVDSVANARWRDNFYRLCQEIEEGIRSSNTIKEKDLDYYVICCHALMGADALPPDNPAKRHLESWRNYFGRYYNQINVCTWLSSAIFYPRERFKRERLSLELSHEELLALN
jgi:hypothetical protein